MRVVDDRQVEGLKSSRWLTRVTAGLVLLLAACSDARPDLSTEGLHRPCPEAGCDDGQTCVTAAAPGGETRTCEIACEADIDCPAPLVCNLPPIVPDSIPDVCVLATTQQ